MTAQQSINQSKRIPNSFTWLFVFLPALTYFISTRATGGFWTELGTPVVDTTIELVIGDSSSTTSCEQLSTIMYVGSCSSDSVQLSYSLQLIQENGLDNVIDIIWKHDTELGRGYLLLSENSNNGRIWRWEKGGGPIPIGKTLHLENSGCRSNHYKDCNSSNENVGSGAIAIDFYNHGTPHEVVSEGALVISEWGEGRIIRLEENGSRTPLLIHIPCISCNNVQQNCRLSQKIKRMIYTPMGDLIIAVNYENDENIDGQCTITTKNEEEEVSTATGDELSEQQRSITTTSAALIVLPYAVHVKSLESLQQSRIAHEWTNVEHKFTSKILSSFNSNNENIGALAITPTFLYYAMTSNTSNDGSTNKNQKIYEISLEDDDDEEERYTKTKESKLHIDLSQYTTGEIIALTFCHNDKVIFVATTDKFVLIIKDKKVLSKITLPIIPTAMTLGDDKYLYIASTTNLYRIRTKEKPIQIPTNQVIKPKKKLY